MKPFFMKFRQSKTEIAVNMNNVAYLAPNGDQLSSVLYFNFIQSDGDIAYLVVEGTVEEISNRPEWRAWA